MPERVASKHMFRNHLKQIMNHSRLYPMMERYSLDTVGFGDDFLGDTLNSNLYTIANGGGAGATSAVITAGVLNGVATLETGTAGDSTASAEICTGLQFRGDQSCVVVACLKLDVITNVKVEVGFTDALDDAGAVNAKVTPTFTATDCAVWCLDTTDNAYWEGLAANNGSTLPMVTVEAAISPVADTYEYLMVELNENDSASNECTVTFRRFDADGYLTYEGVGGRGTNQGPNGNVLLTPWIYIEARSAAEKIMTLDYFGAWQRRTSSS